MTDRDDPSGSTPPDRKNSPRRKWPWVVLLSVVLMPALLMGLWTAIALTYTYSKGYRTGYIQKLSEKGWICKTWEGEIAMVNVPGAMQERFEFTVRSDSIATEINKQQGRRVKLHYREHKGVPFSCFGETKYFVDGVETVDEMGMPAASPPPATQAPAGTVPPPPPPTPPAPGAATGSP